MTDQDSTRLRILEAAGQLFAGKGFDSITVREITQLAGVNVAAVNYHFRSKEDLYIEAVRLAGSSCDQTTPPPTDVEQFPPEQRLRAFIHVFVTRMKRTDVPEWHRELIMRELAQPRCVATEVFVEQFVRPTFAMLTTILREMVPATVPVEEIHLLGNSIVGQCLHQHHARNVIPLLVGAREYRTYTIERLTDHIWRFSLAAIRGLHPVREKGEKR
jgi:AcrR family transcriptional regulator